MSQELPPPPSEIYDIVREEFVVEEEYVEFGRPTFHVRVQPNSKRAFLRLVKRLEGLGYVPILRRRGGQAVLQVLSKPPSKPSSWIPNLILFLITLGTTFATGYVLSLGWVERGWMASPFIGAGWFTLAIMSIIGLHELGHKLAAWKHGVEASYPYFIPGPPPPIGIGTFGAVIKQRSLPPNRDALFDLGISGPLVGLVVTVLMAVLGVQHSRLIPMAEVPKGAQFYLIINAFPPPGRGEVLWLHPVAFASWVGILVTMLNILPAGMLDGGHVARSVLGEKASRILSFLSILILILLGYYIMAVVALLLSLQRHPGPLDDVSELSPWRKALAASLIPIFILTAVPL